MPTSVSSFSSVSSSICLLACSFFDSRKYTKKSNVDMLIKIKIFILNGIKKAND